MRQTDTPPLRPDTSGRTLLAKKALRLRLAALSVAAGIRSGSFRSMKRGQGMEFSGVRDYLAGDDIRSIDWNVTARMGRPFVKLFEEEREMTVLLVADQSLSMMTGAGRQTRAQCAAEAGQVLALAALQLNCPVGAVFFDGKIRFSCMPATGLNHCMLILNKFDAAGDTQTRGSALNRALEGAYRLLRNRALVVVLSDFRSSGYEDTLAALACKHDVLAIRFTDPSDFRIPDIGTALFFDPESRKSQLLPTGSDRFGKEWKVYNTGSLESWRSACAKRGAVPLVISDDDDPVRELTAFFAARSGTR